MRLFGNISKEGGELPSVFQKLFLLMLPGGGMFLYNPRVETMAPLAGDGPSPPWPNTHHSTIGERFFPELGRTLLIAHLRLLNQSAQ
jgi:hypothetical protein